MSSLVARALALSLLAALLVGCGGSTELVCKKDPITGSDHCQPVSNSGGEAAVAAGVAAAAWGAVGCTVNGCVGPYRCNGKTKQCDPIACDENAPCPGPYVCNLGRHRCE